MVALLFRLAMIFFNAWTMLGEQMKIFSLFSLILLFSIALDGDDRGGKGKNAFLLAFLFFACLCISCLVYSGIAHFVYTPPLLYCSFMEFQLGDRGVWASPNPFSQHF